MKTPCFGICSAYVLPLVLGFLGGGSAHSPSLQVTSRRILRTTPPLLLPAQHVELSNHNNVISALTIRGGAGADLEKKVPSKGRISVGRLLEFHKALWLPVCLYLRHVTGNTSERMSLMTGFFGGYGVLWVIKSYVFWDKTFYGVQNHLPMIGAVINWALLSLFFFFPYVAAHNTAPMTSTEMIAATLSYVIGAFFHYGADAQKFFSLKYNQALVTDGLFARSRHPSYFGEFLIWVAFVITAGRDQWMSYIPFVYTNLSMIVLGVVKEKSLSRYPDYEEWKKNTWPYFPKPF